jgi:hypothetical protein
VQHLAVHRDAGTDPGAEDRGEHDRRPGSCAIGGFRQAPGSWRRWPARPLAHTRLHVACSGCPFSQVELQFFISLSGPALPGVPMPIVTSPPAAERAALTTSARASSVAA